MSIKVGFVGLPNVGKSTIFNALTRSSVPAENYPFCTIDPHVAITHVPDERMTILQKQFGSKKLVPTTLSFVDIAGLVKGAASGEGLGNQFLSHIREVDLIINVVRAFKDPDIIRSAEELDPLGDYEIINAELMLKDLESVEKRIAKVEQLLKAARSEPARTKPLEQELLLLKKIEFALNAGDSKAVMDAIKEGAVETIPLLCAKKFLVLANVSEEELDGKQYEKNEYYRQLVAHFGADRVIPICGKIEYELSQLSDDDSQELMSLVGLEHRGLDEIITKSYKALNLVTFFTCGPQEIHAWTIPQGTLVRQAAGEIHSDLERGFICAEIYNYDDLQKCGSPQAIKERGLLRTEGADYIVQDGDIINVRFNV